MTQPYRPEPTESKRVLASRSPEFLKIDQSRKSKTRPPGSLRCRVPSRTAAYLRTSSTSAGASPGHTARRRSRLGPAARTAQSQCDGSRYTLRQRTCSGIRIWSGTETLATARKHGKRPAHPPRLAETQGVATISEPCGRRGRLYVRPFPLSFLAITAVL